MYKVLSNYYDAFMPQRDYKNWLSFALPFLEGRERGVDLACGSGRFTIELVKAGFDVYGVDISPQMLTKAYINAQNEGLAIRFIKGDINKVTFMRPPQFVTVICDGFNYIKNLNKAFSNIYNQLENDGVLIFDISSEYKLRQILSNNTYSDSIDDITYIWNNYLRKDRVDMELTFFEKEGEYYKKVVESQTQFIHKLADVVNSLEGTGFKNVQVYDECKSNPTNNTERIHFIAYK